MNIALIGAQSAGKTTLAKALSPHFPNLKLIVELNRIHSSAGLNDSPQSDLDACTTYLRAFREANWNFISDRSGIDPVGYAVSRNHWSVLEALIETAQEVSKHLTYLFYVPPMSIIPVEDPDFQGLVASNIVDFLVVYGISYTKLYSMSLEGRVKEIVEHIRLYPRIEEVRRKEFDHAPEL